MNTQIKKEITLPENYTDLLCEFHHLGKINAELLEALNKLTYWVGTRYETGAEPAEYHIAKQAIAKAEGV